MQTNWYEKYPTQVGYFSHVNAGSKVDETSHLGEMPHLI